MAGEAVGSVPNNKFPQEVMEAVEDERIVVVVWARPDGSLMSLVNNRFVNEKIELKCSNEVIDVLGKYIGIIPENGQVGNA